MTWTGVLLGRRATMGIGARPVARGVSRRWSSWTKKTSTEWKAHCGSPLNQAREKGKGKISLSLLQLNRHLPLMGCVRRPSTDDDPSTGWFPPWNATRKQAGSSRFTSAVTFTAEQTPFPRAVNRRRGCLYNHRHQHHPLQPRNLSFRRVVSVMEPRQAVVAVVVVVATMVVVVEGKVATTLDGPFKPVTVPLADQRFRHHAVDLPHTDPRLQKVVNEFEPEQISVSLSATYDSVWITWVTGDFQIGDNVKPLDPTSVASVVRYGRSRRLLLHQTTGRSLVYSQLYSFEGLKNYTSGIIHHVRLTGLKPATRYYYSCGDPSIHAMSGVHFFRTMPVSAPRSYPGRIAIVGDLGLTYNTSTVVDHMRSNHPDLFLLVGDVTYANLYLTNGTGADCYSCSFSDTPIHETFQPRWDYWGRFMQPLVSEVPMMVVEGNHEIELQAGNVTFEAYRSRFAFPSEESGSSSVFYYSFNAGGVHFIMLGSYAPYTKSSDQYKWLKKDLAKVDRSVTPWLIAAWHSPWYTSYRAHYRELECMRVEMEELLYTYGVDVIFNGHVHAYERLNRVYNYTLDPCGPVHITVGDGGNREKMAIPHADEPGNCPDPLSTPEKYQGGFCAFNFTTGPAAGKFCWDRQPEWSAYRESSFGHGILEVKNETYALWTWHRNQDDYSVSGDQIYIVRQPDKCLTKPMGMRDDHHGTPKELGGSPASA